MSTKPAEVVTPLRIADARKAVRHVFIRDLVLQCCIGVHRHEKRSLQPVRINLDLAVHEGADLDDALENVVCYEKIADQVRELVNGRHINLVETLAEEIAAMCLQDKRAMSVRVRLEKLDAIADAASVGVEIERFCTNRES
jgi:dihydroneopterin aldolase